MSLISPEGSFHLLVFFSVICSDPSCRFGYLKRWSVCQRSLGSDCRCSAPLVDLSLVLAIADVPESPAISFSSLPCSLSSVRSSPKRMILVAVQAAIDCHLLAELASIGALIYDTFLGRLCFFHVHNIQHVPRMARPLLASCLSQEFSAVNQHGLWSFARILMFAKLVLHSPPHAGQKKRHLVGSLVIMCLWHSLPILLLLLLCSLQLFWQLCIHFQGVLLQIVLAFVPNIFLMLFVITLLLLFQGVYRP